MYGAGTEDTKIHYRVIQGKQIRYVDVINMYPYICKYGYFPVGHPIVYVDALSSRLCA